MSGNKFLFDKLLLKELSELDARGRDDFIKMHGECDPESIKNLKDLAERGIARELAIEYDGERIGTAFYSVVEKGGERFLFIVDVFSDAGFNLYRDFEKASTFLKKVEAIGKKENCAAIVCDTNRPGAMRIFINFGFIVESASFFKKI